MLGTAVSPALAGAVLTRDIEVAGERWLKGRLLTTADLARVARALPVTEGRPITVLIPGPDDVHEDDAARRLAAAVGGPGVAAGEPAQSRIDLRAIAAGVVRIRGGLLERLNMIDPVEVFTILDGRVVEAGALVASVKVAPHLVRRASSRPPSPLRPSAGPAGWCRFRRSGRGGSRRS